MSQRAPAEVAIFGAGKLGALVHDCLAGDERWHCTGFHDDEKAGEYLQGLPIWGTGADVLTPGRKLILAVGDPAARRTLVERFTPAGIEWQSFIDRRSMVGGNAQIGRGVVVLCFTMITSGVTVGDFAYCSAYSHIGTSSRIGAYSAVLAGASVGESQIGEECVIGMKSICLDGAIIGDRTVVAPMTLVRRQVPSDALVAGNPARVFPRGTGEGVPRSARTL